MIAQIWHRGQNIKSIKKIWGVYENEEDWSQSCTPSIAQPHGPGETMYESKPIHHLSVYVAVSPLIRAALGFFVSLWTMLQRESLTFVGHRKGSSKGTLIAQHMPTPLGLAAVWAGGSDLPIRITPPGLSERLLTLLNQGKESCRQVRKSWG